MWHIFVILALQIKEAASDRELKTISEMPNTVNVLQRIGISRKVTVSVCTFVV